MAFLSEKERKTLAILCDTIIPSLEPEPDDNPDLFRLAASDLDIPALMEEALERVTTAAEQREFKLLLHGLETGLVCGLIAGQWAPISQMPLQAREKVLYKLAISRFERGRTAFQSIKRLSAFLFYAVMPDAKLNPAWDAMDYTLPDPKPSRPRTIEPTPITGPTTLECDVLVIGSGAGGGVVAGELATAGHNVIIAEKGNFYHPGDFDGSEFTSMETHYEKYGALVTKDTTMSILAGSVFGGGTTVNWMASFRTPDNVLREWYDVFGFEGACSPDLQDSFDQVSRRLCIGTEFSKTNANNSKLIAGAESLGMTVNKVALNLHGEDGDPGFFCFGPADDTKKTTAVTYLQDAYDAGARILVNAHVDRVTQRAGEVTGAAITVTDADGQQHSVMVKAKAVVVSAGTIHTPAILLRSGLTNPNIGGNVRLHPTTVISGDFDDPIKAWSGAPLTTVINDFKNLDGNGYGTWLECAPSHPGLMALATAWTDGRQHKRAMQRMAHTANVIILTRDRDGGRISLDKHGQPVVDYRLSDYDAAHMMVGIKQALKIHVAAGAKAVHSPHNDYPTFTPGGEKGLDYFLAEIELRGLKPNGFALFSAHQMSSARIAGDAARGAVDPTGQTYEVKNLYVADGSALPNAPGVNPMLSIMGVSHYIAQQIKTRL